MTEKETDGKTSIEEKKSPEQSLQEQIEAIESSSFMKHINANPILLEEWKTLTPQEKHQKWFPWAMNKLGEGFHQTAEELNGEPQKKSKMKKKQKPQNSEEEEVD